jgi:outer membrane protein assembly complex protein YaeT
MEPEGVAIVFHLEEVPFLASVEYSGSRLLSQKQIEKLLEAKKLTPGLGGPADPSVLQRIAFAIRSGLKELGHPEASVRIAREEARNATVSVRFEISDGPQLRVRQVSFAGNPQFSTKLLRGQMRSLAPWKPFASLRNKDAYTREAFEEDRDRILSFYQDHGYPEARIGSPQVARLSEPSRRWLPWPHAVVQTGLSLLIPVEAGPFYRFESIKSSAAFQQVVAERGGKSVKIPDSWEGRPYSVRAIENLRRSWMTRIQPQNPKADSAPFRALEARPVFNADKHTANVTFNLSDSPPYLVQRIEFQGLHKFSDRYLRRRIPLREGQPVNDRALEAGLARLARTGYFKPIRKEDIHVQMNDLTHTANIAIRVEEIGQQRASLIGGQGQFGRTLGIAYTLFDLLNREELLSAQMEGGPESLQIILGLAKEGIFGTRASLAFSVFNNVLRPRFAGSAQGPFFTSHNVGINIPWTYAASSTDSLTVSYTLSRAATDYKVLSPSTTGVTSSDVRTRISSRTLGAGWTHDTGNERLAFSNAISGGVLGGGENMLSSSGEYGRILRDPIFSQGNAWAIRTTFRGAGTYRGEMPFDSRLFSSDEIVRGLRPGELGPYALTPKMAASGATTYSAVPAGANLLAGANAEYRIPLVAGTEAAGFFDIGSGWLLPHWLGPLRPLLLRPTNGALHGSTGIEFRWTIPGVQVPFRAYYALNVLRLDRSMRLSDKCIFFARNRFSAFGWGLGSLF